MLRARDYSRRGYYPKLALAPRPEGVYSNEILRLISKGLAARDLDNLTL